MPAAAQRVPAPRKHCHLQAEPRARLRPCQHRDYRASRDRPPPPAGLRPPHTRAGSPCYHGTLPAQSSHHETHGEKMGGGFSPLLEQPDRSRDHTWLRRRRRGTPAKQNPAHTALPRNISSTPHLFEERKGASCFESSEEIAHKAFPGAPHWPAGEDSASFPLGKQDLQLRVLLTLTQPMGDTHPTHSYFVLLLLCPL